MVENFCQQLTKTTKLNMHCKSGCSKCCYVDLSIFEIEKSNIISWFKRQSTEEKIQLKKLWNKPLNSQLNFNNEEVKSCAFLNNEMCTIYEARPLICRTQGIALMYTHLSNNKKYVDICPLNEEVLHNIAKSEILNLDLTNTLLSNINGEQNTKRISLTEIKDQLLNEEN